MTLCECGCGLEVKPGNRFIYGHNKGNLGKFKPKPKSKLCECGCGELAKPENRFIYGHNRRGRYYWEPQIPQLCECGCGELAKSGNRFINGHNWRGEHHTPGTKKKMVDSHTGIPLPPKNRAAMLEARENSPAVKAAHEARRGVPLPPKWCAAMSDGSKNSDAVKANAEAMRGGNDIVGHHYVYDHDDLSKYIMEMTRSQHSSLHRNMQTLGLKVPHINTGHETEDELKLMEYINKIESEQYEPKGL